MLTRVVFTTLFLLFLGACQKDDILAERSYRMGFAISGPRYDFNTIMAALHIWVTRADAAIISDQVPWDSLFNGRTPQQYVQNNYVGLVNYYRGLGLKLWIFLDPENGLDRTTDAIDLKSLGKSISDADVQQLFRRYAVVMDSMLHPDHLGLALETNLIRDAAPSPIYNGVKQAVNDAAADLRAKGSEVKLSISVQADDAWGKLLNTPYVGIDQDFKDFPFIQELGISSYPYFAFNGPGDIPPDYYSRLVTGKPIPVFISEGGWSSSNVPYNGKTLNGSPDLQKQYIALQDKLLSSVNGIAYFQLAFTDIDVASLPPYVPSSIQYFSSLGMVDINLQNKPALNEWDALFKRPLKSGN